MQSLTFRHLTFIKSTTSCKHTDIFKLHFIHTHSWQEEQWPQALSSQRQASPYQTQPPLPLPPPSPASPAPPPLFSPQSCSCHWLARIPGLVNHLPARVVKTQETAPAQTIIGYFTIFFLVLWRRELPLR